MIYSILLPWNNFTKEVETLKKANDVLEKDHAGLKMVKKRILEFLVVRFLKDNTKGRKICLDRSPGVGKTPLVKSITYNLGRKYVRVALGRIRDETEVRGHILTYLGALLGVFINAIRTCKSKNRLNLLYKVDKINHDCRSDPSIALLEVLDPE